MFRVSDPSLGYRLLSGDGLKGVNISYLHCRISWSSSVA